MAQTKKFFGIFTLIIVSLIFGACTDYEDTDTRNLIQDEPGEIVNKDVAVSKELEHDVDTKEDAASDRMTASLTVKKLEGAEIVDEYSFTEHPTMDASIEVTRPEYTITEDLLESEVVGTSISRNYEPTHVTYGGFEEKDTVIVSLNDGQELRLPVIIMTHSVETADGRFVFGSDSLISAKFISAENVETRPMTRSTYVKRAVNTLYTVELTFAEKNTQRDSTFTVELKGMAVRNIIAEDAVESVEVVNKNREVLDETTERISFDKEITMKSGETVKVSKSLVLNREFKGIEGYDKFVSSFAYTFGNANGVANGNESSVKTEDGWSVFGRTDNYSANIGNGVSSEAVRTSYSLYHERATYKDEDVTVEFGYENVTVSEVKTNVTAASSDKGGYDKNVLNNEIRTSYINYTQNLSEYVNLYKTAKAVASEGWDESSAKMTISNGSVICSIDWITRYNTGETEKESYRKTFARSLKNTSNWTSVEANASQNTGAANVTLKSAAKADGFWKWNEETRTITTTATLAGSKQVNSWTAVDPNAISLTREGKTYKFESISFEAVENGAAVTKATENDEWETYSYSDKLVVKFGSNSQNTSASGTIKVAKEVKGDFPAEWGKFVKAVSTLSITEDTKDWVYTWSIHFENGTLPVVIRKNDATVAIDQTLFEYAVDSRFNSASYVNSKWINSIASDEPNYMLWQGQQSNAYRLLPYTTATMWKWNNGKNTVKCDKFTFSVENDGKVLVIKKDGEVFASYRASVR